MPYMDVPIFYYLNLFFCILKRNYLKSQTYKQIFNKHYINYKQSLTNIKVNLKGATCKFAQSSSVLVSNILLLIQHLGGHLVPHCYSDKSK